MPSRDAVRSLLRAASQACEGPPATTKNSPRSLDALPLSHREGVGYPGPWRRAAVRPKRLFLGPQDADSQSVGSGMRPRPDTTREERCPQRYLRTSS